jgi:hypothetical protein
LVHSLALCGLALSCWYVKPARSGKVITIVVLYLTAFNISSTETRFFPHMILIQAITFPPPNLSLSDLNHIDIWKKLKDHKKKTHHFDVFPTHLIAGMKRHSTCQNLSWFTIWVYFFLYYTCNIQKRINELLIFVFRFWRNVTTYTISRITNSIKKLRQKCLQKCYSLCAQHWHLSKTVDEVSLKWWIKRDFGMWNVASFLL